MIEAGLETEVRTLIENGVPENAQSMSGLGYKEMIPYLHGLTDLDRAIYEIKLGTRHYAKRQMTYMKRFSEAFRTDPSEHSAYEQIRGFLCGERK